MRERGRRTALAVVIGVPLLLLVVVLVVGAVVTGLERGAGGAGGAGDSAGAVEEGPTGAGVPTGEEGTGASVGVGAGDGTGSGKGAEAGPAVDPVPYDHATWCSPERGDCVRVDLPRVEGFGGASLVTRMPTAADPDGCWRALAADFWLWYCPPGAVVDTEAHAAVDAQDAELERLYVKFKNLEGWRYLRAE